MSEGGPAERIAPPGFLADPAPAAVLAALPGARAVGGCVRDALAGRPVHDIDVAAPLPPEAILQHLRRAGLRVFETGLAHGTVTAVLDGVPVEVTALRRDVATDGRHAEVEWTTSWTADAARRDFTINAMSLSAAGELWDYHGGRNDLAAGRVRFVGDAARRLSEDYLRALRFFRFQARYGRGAPDAPAIAAITEAAGGGRLARLSAERVWMELKRLLEAPDLAEALGLMRHTGVLAAILPEAAGLSTLHALVAHGAPADPLLRFAAMLPEGADAAALATRLRLSGEERATLHRLLQLAQEVPAGADAAAIRRFMGRREGAARADALGEAWLAEARDGASRAPLRAALHEAPWPEFPLLGRDVLALGLPPGPAVGRLLSDLRAWWVEGGCVADRAACLEELRRRAGG